jgi:hypothetical protein
MRHPFGMVNREWFGFQPGRVRVQVFTATVPATAIAAAMPLEMRNERFTLLVFTLGDNGLLPMAKISNMHLSRAMKANNIDWRGPSLDLLFGQGRD